MTCIVGVEHNGKVYMGGDRCGSSSWSQMSVDRPKVFINKKLIIGYTTSFRFGDILEFGFTPPPHKKGTSDIQYMYTVANAIRKVLKDEGFASNTAGSESGGNCLIGYKGKLYELQPEYSLLRAECGFNAVGSGEYVALGAMHALQEVYPEPNMRIELALKAAQAYCPGVRAPFDILSI